MKTAEIMKYSNKETWQHILDRRIAQGLDPMPYSWECTLKQNTQAALDLRKRLDKFRKPQTV